MQFEMTVPATTFWKIHCFLHTQSSLIYVNKRVYILLTNLIKTDYVHQDCVKVSFSAKCRFSCWVTFFFLKSVILLLFKNHFMLDKITSSEQNFEFFLHYLANLLRLSMEDEESMSYRKYFCTDGGKAALLPWLWTNRKMLYGP